VNTLALLGLLFFLLVVITLIGHGVWMVVGWLFSGGQPGERPVRAGESVRSCPGCERETHPDAQRCHWCNLDLYSRAAAELADLLATVRQLERFERSGLLNQVILGRLQTAIQIRRRQLGFGGAERAEPHIVSPVSRVHEEREQAVTIPEAPPLPPPPVESDAGAAPLRAALEEAALPPWRRLEQLLLDCRDVRELTSSRRVQALLWYGQSAEEQLAALATAAQLALAQLLAQVGRTEDALAAYRRLLTGHPEHPRFAETALEAGQLAFQMDRREEAAWFLQKALAKSLPPSSRRAAEELLRRLTPVVVAQPLPEPGAPGALTPGEGEEEPAVAELVSPGADAPGSPTPSAPVAPERRPRRSLGEVLAAFMEERNILWGELVGGLLIVGCSIALVISLWKTLEEIPYFPFLIFAGITTALFGAGLYTLHHWKLESTSRGLLVIATLLVPLNFLVMAGLSKDEAGDLLALLIDGAALLLFAWFVHRAARVFVPDGRLLLPLAILGASAGQLLVPHLLGPVPPEGWRVALLSLVPVAFFGLGVGGVVRKAAGYRPLQGAHVVALLAFLGLASFTLLIVLGFLVFLVSQDAGLGAALNRAALAVALAGIPVLASGLLVHRGLDLAGVPAAAPEEAPGPRASLAALRTAGTAVFLGGIVVMLVGVALAWPQPAPLALVCALNCTVLTAIAIDYRMPLAHAAAIPCLAIGGLSYFYLHTGQLTGYPAARLGLEWLRAIVFDMGWLALLAVAFLLAAMAEVCVRARLQPHAVAYALGSAAVALVAWALVSLNGIGDPGSAAAASIVCAAGYLAMSVRWRRPQVVHAGLLLVLASTVWGLEWGWPVFKALTGQLAEGRSVAHLAFWSPVLALEALTLGVLALVLSGAREASWRSWIAPPLARVAVWVGVPAAVAAVWAAFLLPWQLEYVAASSCLFLLAVVLTIRSGNLVPARWAGGLFLAAVVFGAGWGGRLAEVSGLGLQTLIALSLAGTSAVLAAVGLRAAHRETTTEAEAPSAPAAYGALAAAWRETCVAAALLGLFLAPMPPPVPEKGLQTASFAVLGLTGLLLGWRYRAAWLIWTGSGLVMISLCHGLYWHADDLAVVHRLLIGLLGHATLGILGGMGVKARKPQETWLERTVIEPLIQSGMLSTALSLPLLLGVRIQPMVLLAGCAGWLATLWLLVAWSGRLPALFTAYQVAMTLAFGYAITAWLQFQGWVIGNYPEGLTDPRSLQCYGIGLGLLGLVWLVVRFGLRRDERAQTLLNPGWVAFDRLILAVLVSGQLLLAVWGVIPEVLKELTPRGLDPGIGAWAADYPEAHGPRAWVLLGVLAAVLLIGLWERRQREGVLGLMVLAMTVPVLVAGEFDTELAGASALRWGLALCFLACAVPLWLRRPLARLAGRLRMPIDPERPPAAPVRRLLITGLAVPVLGLTAAVALLRFLGERATGPDPDSFFAQAGRLVANGVPLALLSLAFVGHALRERSAGHAFTAGLIANLTLMGGYALEVVRTAGRLSAVDWVRLLQWGTVGAAVWTLAWLLSRRWVSAWRPGPESPRARPLMAVQVGMGLLGNAALLLAGLDALLLTFTLVGPDVVTAVYPPAPPWAMEMGSLLGWLALGLAVAAAFLRDFPRRIGLPLNAVGLVVVAELALLACTVERLGPGWGYRTFLVGCGGWALLVSLGAWGIDRRTPPERRTEAPAHVATRWVSGTALLVLFLALKAALMHQDHLWAAAAIALASMAGAALAVWHRRSDWAFGAGLGFNLTASLVVWYAHRVQGLEEWWLTLFQANVIASAGATLLWLWLRRRLHEPADLARTAGVPLAVQVALGCVGNILLLLLPLLMLVVDPNLVPANLARVGDVWGWLALTLALAAAVWYFRQVEARMGVHLMGVLGLALGVLLACTVSRGDAGNWLSFHVLTASWLIVGQSFLVTGLAIGRQARSRPEGEAFPADSWLDRLLPGQGRMQGWVLAIGGLVVLLALRGTWADPQRPWWSAGATLAVSWLVGAVAFWPGRAGHVYASGLLVNLAGVFAWLAWGPETPASFVSTNVLCLGLTSAFWSLLAVQPATRDRLPDRQDHGLPYSYLAAQLGLGFLGLLALAGVEVSLTASGQQWADPLTWAAFAALALALLLCLWDERAWFTLPGWYALGLVGLALALHGLQLSPPRFGWMATLLLGGYVLLTTLLGWAVLHRRQGGQAMGQVRRSSAWAPAWFATVEIDFGGLVAALSLWVVLDFDRVGQRLGGPLAVVFLLPAAVLLAGMTRGGCVSGLRQATLVLIALALTEGGWALLDPQAPAVWLYREVILLAVLAGLTFAYRLVPSRLPNAAAWERGARRVGGVFGLLAAVLLVLILGHEALLYDAALKTTPLAPAGVVAVALGLVVLLAAWLGFAVVPAWDPLGLSERRRGLYVYGGEVLLVLLFVHLRLNVPWIFGKFGVKYWTLIVMAIAFLGVGLSEYFTRRGLTVLAEPLRRTGIFLPLLPLLGFWLQSSAPVQEFAQEQFPAVGPVLKGVPRPAGGFAYYALLWFLVGALYTVVAATRRSFRFALLAALAVNFGLWAMLYHYGWQFLIHPQMWLIPLALIVLVAEHVNRDRLTRTQGLSLRYLALGMLYLSSTADMFITGVGNSVLLPLVLAVLSILGVLAGILLRVRAFLFLGVAFLFLVIFSMIWHAAVDRTQTWVWWASGIVLGVGIVALFAVFEKRRNDVLRLIEEIKKWD
jgi:hypothetical protein